MTCVIVKDCNILLKKDLHRSLQVVVPEPLHGAATWAPEERNKRRHKTSKETKQAVISHTFSVLVESTGGRVESATTLFISRAFS